MAPFEYVQPPILACGDKRPRKNSFARIRHRQSNGQTPARKRRRTSSTCVGRRTESVSLESNSNGTNVNTHTRNFARTCPDVTQRRQCSRQQTTLRICSSTRADLARQSEQKAAHRACRCRTVLNLQTTGRQHVARRRNELVCKAAHQHRLVCCG